MATITERFNSGGGRFGLANDSTGVLRYIVEGTLDEAEVIELVLDTIPSVSGGLLFQNLDCDVEGRPDRWAVVVNYGTRQPRQVGQQVINFNTSGSTQQITQSLRTVNKYGASGITVPDCRGAIGVTKDSIEGVQITIPTFQFSKTCYVDAGNVTDAYVQNLFRCTGCKNGSQYGDYAPGELLYLGASGSQRSSDDFEITHAFAASPNFDSLSIGAITDITKKGWDYLWVMYRPVKDGSFLVKQPVAVYVEEVYPDAEFSGIVI